MILFVLLMIVFVITLPFFALFYKFVPSFKRQMDELYEDDPLMIDSYGDINR